MFIDIDILPEIFFQAALFLGLYYLFYRQYIYSIFDPLFLYIFTLSFSSVLVNRVLFQSQPLYAYHFFWCHLFFFTGFILTSYKFRNIKELQLQPIHSIPSFPDYKTFRIILYILFVLFLLTNIFLFFTKGFTLLSDDPSKAKVENFTKGFGIINRINKTVGSFILMGLFLFIFCKPRYFDIFLLLLTIVLKALTGTKSAFVDVTYTVALIAHHSMFRYNRKIMSTLKLLTPLGLIGIFIVAFTVFIKESADTEQAVLKFVIRLLYGADSTLYFYQPVNEQYFAQFHFWEYPSYIFNGILTLFRLVPAIEANGNMMVLNVIDDPSSTFSGPNTPYYIEGQIYFGYYGAYVYSAIIGACFAYSREIFFNKQFQSAFTFVLMGCITNLASAITIEASYGISKIFEICFFVIPVYIVVNLTVHGRIKWKRLKLKKVYSVPVKTNESY